MAYKKTPKVEETEKTCDCDSTCTCGCNEGKSCSCNNDQHNEENCNCEHENCSCEDSSCNNDECHRHDNLAEEYLNMARVIQADFDNYRKRSIESIRQAKIDGVISAVEVILPCLDVFKKAKQMIKDENSLKGIEMLETEINNSLKTLGIEKIDTQNAQFNPNLHYALAVIEDTTKPNNEIVEEYQAGYKMGEKIIKYSQVIVNKLKEEQ